jgi:hypothetical protein
LYVAHASLFALAALVEGLGFNYPKWLWPVNPARSLTPIRLPTQEVLILKLVLGQYAQVATQGIICLSGMGLLAPIAK